MTQLNKSYVLQEANTLFARHEHESLRLRRPMGCAAYSNAKRATLFLTNDWCSTYTGVTCNGDF